MDDVNTHQQLRPYFDPDTFNAGYSSVFKPDQGVVDSHGFSIASKLNIMSQSKSKLSKSFSEPGMLTRLTTGIKTQVRDVDNSAEEAQKTLSNMEWNDLLNWRSWKSIGTNLLEQFLRRYVRHLVQQPFEVSRLLLQVSEFEFAKPNDQSKISLELEDTAINKTSGHGFEHDEEEDADEAIEFFPKAHLDEGPNWSDSPHLPLKHTDHGEHDHTSPTLTKKIQPDSLHTMDVLNAIMEEEGSRGLWRANNTTFIYNFLSVTLDAWFTGLLSPFLQIPDPYFIDIVHSSDPRKSIFLTIGASVFAGLVLLPVDLIRTRLTITSVKVGNRSLRDLLGHWSWSQNASSIPLDMLALNVGHSITSTVFTKLTGILLYHRFKIDRFSHAMWYNVLELLSQMLELLFRLPVENLLRRSQTAYLLRNKTNDPFPVVKDDLIIIPREYKGISATLRDTHRVHELWRGWRLGLLSVACGCGLKMMNSEALEEEKF
ncbi:LADA_0G07536g1_1 [Lachancea dasiensis]|uniref:LADA_0G07536g1_1 n=1 Tax=Lachancea dasiensis TaxID=1072105 RepID=A0A1G4JU14_9SACH|nr:LADA_0G07536g1_1 [Lachancea dasiensis]